MRCAGSVIKGWDEGIAQLPLGGKVSLLTIDVYALTLACSHGDN